MLEIIDARIMAPYFGASVYVWTAIIGVILGSLSLGYWYGGVLADKKDDTLRLADIFLLASATLMFSKLIQDFVLNFVLENISGLRLQALTAAFLIFFPLNMLLGMVSPFIAKLSLKDTKNSGRTVGNLFAAGTLGSIFGVFITGYFLLGLFGNSALMTVLILVIALNAYIVRELPRHSILAFVLAVAVLVMFITGNARNSFQSNGGRAIYDGDSAYSRVIVEERLLKGKKVRGLITNEPNVYQSFSYLDSKDPVFAYTRMIQAVSQNLKDPKKALQIGGGAYTTARDFVEDHKSSALDVVEIDPKLMEVAKKYFFLGESGRIRNINQDGRTFLNTNSEQYDFVIMDAYTGSVPPFQLCSVESIEKIRNSLAPEGLLIANIFGYAQGADSNFLWSQYKTYAQVFDHVAIVRADPEKSPDQKQSYILLVSNSAESFGSALDSTGAQPLTFSNPDDYVVFTDDFAPVEQLMGSH